MKKILASRKLSYPAADNRSWKFLLLCKSCGRNGDKAPT